MRHLRDSGRVTEVRAEAEAAKHDKSRSGPRGDFGDRLKNEPSIRGLRLGKNGARKTAVLVEAEIGTGPIFDDVVSDETRRAQLAGFVRDRIERSARPGIDKTYAEVMRVRWDYLTDEAKAREIARARRGLARPSKVAAYLDRLRALAAAPVWSSDDPPAALMADDLSPEDEGELAELRVDALGRLRELASAYPPVGADRVRLRATAKLLDRDLATSPGAGGASLSPRDAPARGVSEKLRTGAPNRSILSFTEERERPLRDLVGDTGQTRAQDQRFPGSLGEASVFSPGLAVWAVTNYARPGDVVLDPFAGGGTRAVMAALADCRYVGTDLRIDQVDLVNHRLRALGLDHLAVVHAADAATFDWAEAAGGAVADLVLTCPPYHDLERYSDDPRDLSNCASYDDFCQAVRAIIEGLRPALRPGATTVWVVGEVRDRPTGRILRLPSDVRSIHETAGLDPFERSIIYRRNQRPRSEGQEAARGRVVGVDEAVVVCRYGQARPASPLPVTSAVTYGRVDLEALLGAEPDELAAEDADLTPIEEHGGFLVKREDLFRLHEVRGSKARQALALIDDNSSLDMVAPGLIGFGGRRSTTAAAIAAAAKERGVEAIFHTAGGQPTREMTVAEELGCRVMRHTPGYLSNIRAKARQDAARRGWPCGLEHDACVRAVTAQVESLVRLDFSRVVVAAGACVVLAGVLLGLRLCDLDVPVLAVSVGAPLNESLLDEHAPGWRDSVEHVHAAQEYEDPAPETSLGALELDPLYEAKAIPYLTKGDLLWNSGIRTR